MLSFELRGVVKCWEESACVVFSFGGELEMDWRMGGEGCGEFVRACWCW